MWGAFVGSIASALSTLHGVVGNWGLAIILFTVAIKIVTWPLMTKQLKSSRAMQELQPKIKAMQAKFKDDKEAQTREMMDLYKEAGVNPAMGCLPMLVQMPVWFGLYRAIIGLAADGTLAAGFLFVPSLAEPNPSNGFGWVLDFASFPQTWGYFILPLLTVVTQIAISRVMTPTPTPSGGGSDPTQAMMKQMTTLMPVMFGAFALTLPAGLALYWVTNNILTGIQYLTINRTASQVTGVTAALAPATADGGTVIKAEVAESPSAKGQRNGKSRRKRKKR